MTYAVQVYGSLMRSISPTIDATTYTGSNLLSQATLHS